jgi:hypothetical protein
MRDPWAGAPAGYLVPFIEVEERDKLIVDRTVVMITRMTPETTKHGKKVYVEIEIPGVDEHRVCSMDASDDTHPRMALLRHLRKWLDEIPGGQIPAVLITAGRGYIFADPRSVA